MDPVPPRPDDLAKSYRRQGLKLLLMGLGLLGLGTLLTLGTLWLARGGGYFVVAYGPVITGFYLVGVGALRMFSGGTGEKTAAKLWTYAGIFLVAGSVAWFDISVLMTIWEWLFPPEDADFYHRSPLAAACGVLSAPLLLGVGCIWYGRQDRASAP